MKFSAWCRVLHDFDWHDLLELHAAGYWPLEVRQTLLALLTCVCLAGGCGMIMFWERKLEATREQLQELSAQLQNNQQVGLRVGEAQRALETTEARLKDASSQLVAREQLPALLNAIVRFAHNKNVTLESIALAPEEWRASTSVAPILISASGDFPALEVFLRTLAATRALLVPGDFQFELAHENKVRLTLEVLVSLHEAKGVAESHEVHTLAGSMGFAEALAGPVLRDPFQQSTLSSGDTEVEPRREPLEQFDLSQLHMLGMLARSDQRWALIRAPSGKVVRVALGEKLGRDRGRVVHIDRDHLVLVEQVQEGGVWKERQSLLRRSVPAEVAVESQTP